MKVARRCTRVLANFKQVLDDLKEECALPELGFVALTVKAEEALKVVFPALRFRSRRKVEDLARHQLHFLAECEVLDAFFRIRPTAESAAEGST